MVPDFPDGAVALVPDHHAGLARLWRGLISTSFIKTPGKTLRLRLARLAMDLIRGHADFPSLGHMASFAPGGSEIGMRLMLSWIVARAFGTVTARRSGDLTGVHQQQLAIARAMIMRPKLPLPDQPTEGIQPIIIQPFDPVIVCLKGRGDRAIILAEPHFCFADALVNQVCVFRRGTMALQRDTSDPDPAPLRVEVSV